MRSNPHDRPVKLPCRRKLIPLKCGTSPPYPISCRREIPHVMSGLFGRKLRIGIHGGDLIVFRSDDPILRSYLALRLTGEGFALRSGEMSLERLAELSAAGTFTLEGGAAFSRQAELRVDGAFAISGHANLLKGRLRLVSEMDDYMLTTWDDMPLTEVDFIIEEEGTQHG